MGRNENMIARTMQCNGSRPNKNKRMSASTYFHGMPYQWDRYAASERGMCSGEKRGDRAVEIV